MITYFISDLHLREQSESTFLLEQFLNKHLDADRLYILGDLFDYWVGDDCLNDYQNKIAQLLSAYQIRTNAHIFFMPGNRDFLIGKEFCKQAHITLLSDPTIVSIDGKKYYLSHGDSFCTEEFSYTVYRMFAQNAFVKKIFLCLPKWLRHKIASSLRENSRRKFVKTQRLIDVDTREIMKAFIDSGSTIIIHGHTHQPDVHKYQILQTCYRYVLSDWHKSANILKVENNYINILTI